jgi:hypothetical protein
MTPSNSSSTCDFCQSCCHGTGEFCIFISAARVPQSKYPRSLHIPFHSIPHLGFKYCGGKEKSTCTASCCCYKSNTCYSVNLQPPYSDITSDAQHQRPPQFFCHDKGENDLSFFSIHSKHWNRIAKFSCVISCRVHAKC